MTTTTVIAGAELAPVAEPLFSVGERAAHTRNDDFRAGLSA